jgi:DNA polymerase-3 subunit chi
MTQIDFYTRVDDKLRTACRLASKAYSQNLRVMVLCSDADTALRFDRMLWTASALGFVPHCGARDALAARTPVIIDHDSTEPLHDEVLLNLSDERPPHFARFRRLLEIVTTDDDDRRAAHARYKFYKDRGYELNTHDLSRADQ